LFTPESKESGWFDGIAKDGDCGRIEKQFGGAMEFASSNPSLRIWHIHYLGDATVVGVSIQTMHALPWGVFFNACQTKIGRSISRISFELMSHHPKLICIVQGYGSLAPSFEKARQESLKYRVNFQAHDFQLQPVKGVELCFLKHILVRHSNFAGHHSCYGTQISSLSHGGSNGT